jgi:colanic acid/amylovoran biosynthesis glycosyltransferase
LFDVYLPSTLSWVAQLLDSLEDVEVEVGSPWMVRNQFFNPKFKHHVFPPQRLVSRNAVPATASPEQRSGLHLPFTEFDFPFWQKLFTASQRHLPTYPFFLEKTLKNDPPDLLHAHFGPTGCLYLPLAKKWNRPLVVTFYGFDYSKLLNLRPVFQEKYRQLFAGAARVIAASEVGCEKLKSMGCPPEKLAVVPPSPHIEAFPFFERKKPSGQLRLAQVATFTAKKGHLTTLEAFRLALANCPNLHLTLAGEQQDKALINRLRDYIATHRLEEKITWLNFIGHHDMAVFLQQFDAFIHPSCHAPDGDHEATPVVLLEAQATGLPVLATDHFDLPKEVLNGKTGLLAPEGDAQILADCIRRFYFMENSEYQQFSRNARHHVEQNFDVKNSAQKLRALYETLSSHPSLLTP